MVRPVTRCAAVLLLLAGTLACGGSTAAPTVPPPPLGAPLTGLCTALTPASQAPLTVGAAGGEVTFPVVAPPGCSWSVSASPASMARPTESSGRGNGVVRVPVQSNPGPARSAVVTLLANVAAGIQTKAFVRVDQAPLIVPVPARPSFLWFESFAGDYVGGGRTEVHTSDTAAFTVVVVNGEVTLQVRPNGVSLLWSLTLEAPLGRALTPGVYEDTRRRATDTQGELSFSGFGRGCNQSYGRFVLSDIAFGTGNSVDRLRVAFEHHCESPLAPVLRGEVWYVR